MKLYLMIRKHYKVSIPNRDFIELQCEILRQAIAPPVVSIPNRDFIELQYLYISFIAKW